LLRVIQEREFMRLGGVDTIKVDVRIIAATNVSLKDMVKQGKFREDLFYRLNVMAVLLPPLRERKGDIPLLISHYIDGFNTEFRKKIRGVSPAAISALQNYPWRGNVRELRNAVERAYILCDGELSLSEQDMPTLRDATGAHASDEIHIPIGATLDEIERTFILATLKHFQGDKRRAADVLGCSLKTLYNKLHAYQRERHAGMN
jgi:two-component system NtrC family response regulator/two-component system response regulator HydG